MKKFIGIIFSLGLAVTLAVTVSAAPNLSGSWSGFGYSFKAAQSGNILTLIATDGDISGKVSLEGAITGNTFEGRQILIAKGCPNLEKYVSAKGTISSDGNSITVTYRNSDYDPYKCVDLPGSESEETGSYTKISSFPAQTTPPKSIQSPQIKKATPTPMVVDNKLDQLQAKQDPNLAEKPTEKSTPFNIFSFNPLETWRNIQGLLDIPAGLNSLIQTAEILSGPELLPKIPEPAISTDDEGKAWDFLPGYISPQGENITVVKGQGQLKPSNSGQSVTVSNTSKNMPAFGTFVDSIFAGNTSEAVQLKYTWLMDSGAVINVAPKTEIKFIKPAPGEAVKEAKRMIMLDKGEIEVKVKNTNPENKFGVQTEILDLIVIGTHFRVSHDPNKKQTVVGVYEGKVEVKTKDGQITTVTPSGDDKPGVIVVAQKFSVTKLALFGLVLVAAIVGIALFLRRKSIKSSGSKKKTAK